MDQTEHDFTADNERWRQIQDSPYEVSDFGRIRRIFHNGAWDHLAGAVIRSGYRIVSLKLGEPKAKSFYVHRLVAEAFLGPRPEGKGVNHKDGNKLNNQISNLEYLTPSEDRQHAIRTGLFPIGERRYNAKLTDEKVKAIWTLTGFGFTRPAIKSLLGISLSSVHHILGRRNWKHLAPPEEIAS